MKTQHPNSLKNLRPQKIASTEQAKKMGSKGGKKTQAKAREKKTFLESLNYALEMEVPENVIKMLKEKGINVQVGSRLKDAMNIAQVFKAITGLGGDTQAYNAISNVIIEDEKNTTTKESNAFKDISINILQPGQSQKKNTTEDL